MPIRCSQHMMHGESPSEILSAHTYTWAAFIFWTCLLTVACCSQPCQNAVFQPASARKAGWNVRP